MAKRITLLTTLILSLVLLPGCPAAPGVPSALVGAWIVTFESTDFGMRVNANGEAIPFEVEAILFGTFTWEIDGTRVLFHQVNGDGRWVWAAELTSDTTMVGAWIGWAGFAYNDSEPFTAVKQPPATPGPV